MHNILGQHVEEKNLKIRESVLKGEEKLQYNELHNFIFSPMLVGQTIQGI